MDVGIPRELKDHEYRVAITPVGVRELTDAGHRVVIEQGAGLGSSITDLEFEKSGAAILETADEVWGGADLILKVKEPVPEEFPRLRKDQVLFTYLHLAASREVTEALLDSGTTGVAYETVELPDGRLPLLAPMSEVAGRMAPQVGAHLLERESGGRGVLMGGVSGVAAAKVLVLGGGMAGQNAAWIAQGMEAEVTLLDKNVDKLRYVDQIHKGRIVTLMSNRQT
ncbi:MAG TPA: alanine dehydrogenase, partial [Actinomycetota bacterium]|nr:alanine dehydrogenase [Actinomycetota bacterium]